MPQQRWAGRETFYPVSLEHGHRRLARRGIVEVDAAGRKESDPGLRRKGRRLPSVEPGGEGLPVEARKLAILVYAHDRLHERALWGKRGGPVGEGRGHAAQLSHQLRIAEEAVLEGHSPGPRFRRARAQHQSREVHLPAVRRGVGTVVVAELALVAEIHHLFHVPGGKLLHIAVHRVEIEPVEQHLEGRTEGEAPSAAAADVVDAAKLAVDGIQLPEIGLPDIEGHPDLMAPGSTARSRRAPQRRKTTR